MDGIPNRAIEALGPFPILQGAVGLLIVLACVYVALRAARDKPTPSPPPQPTPIQIESPWLVQHLVEIHLIIDQMAERLEKIARKIGAD